MRARGWTAARCHTGRRRLNVHRAQPVITSVTTSHNITNNMSDVVTDYRCPHSWRVGLARDKTANGRDWARTNRERAQRAENYTLKYTKAPPSFRRATSPFSKSALSLFWTVLFEIPGSIAITSPTPSFAPGDSKHFKTSFSPCLMRCSSSGKSEAMSWCSSIGKYPLKRI